MKIDSEIDGLHNDRNDIFSERFIKSIFGLLGIGVLLPWNAFVSAKPYFQARLCSKANEMSANVELWFGFVYNLSSVVSLASIILLQWWRDRQKKVTYESAEASALELCDTMAAEENESEHQNYWMIVAPLSAYLIVFGLTTLLVLFPSIPTIFFLSFTLAGLAICGVCTAFASAGIVGTAGMFPSSIGINPYFSGQAVGGVAVSCANFIAAVLEDPEPFRETYCQDTRMLTTSVNVRRVMTCVPYHQVDWASFSYFLLGSIVLAACIVGYSFIDKYQRITARASYESLAETDASQLNTNVHESTRGDIELYNQVGEMRSGLDSSSDDSPKAWDSSEQSPPPDELTVVSVLHAVRAPAFSIFMIFFVTLSLFPSWTSQLKSKYECQSRIRLANDLYTPLTFVVFNAADLTGRVWSGSIHLDRIQHVSRKLMVCSLSRLIFIPLFLLCMARDSVYANAAFHSDMFSLLVQAIFGIGNGMVTTLSFMHAPTLLPPVAKTQTRASEILNLALSFGLLCGSIISFPFSRVATGHW